MSEQNNKLTFFIKLEDEKEWHKANGVRVSSLEVPEHKPKVDVRKNFTNSLTFTFTMERCCGNCKHFVQYRSRVDKELDIDYCEATPKHTKVFSHFKCGNGRFEMKAMECMKVPDMKLNSNCNSHKENEQ